jgi:hypothetical protein
MALQQLRAVATLVVAPAILWFLGLLEAAAQSGSPYMGDGPNLITHTDMAAGQMVDSLFTPGMQKAPPKFKPPGKKPLPAPGPVVSRIPIKGKLVRNPDTADGSSQFALVDRYGGVLRYVEPVDGIDLDAHVGQWAKVHHDTGDILLASQIDLSTAAAPDGKVQLADFEEELTEPGQAGEESIITPVPEGGLYEEGPIYSEGQPYMDMGVEYGDYPQCGSMICPQPGGCSPCARGILYVRAEYLLWWFDGFDTPPLVVEGDADDGDFVDAVVVYGNERILDGDRSGFRLVAGLWLDDCGVLGIEGDYFGFDTETEQFTDGGDGETPPFVGRPFIDATTGFDAVQDVSFPGIMGTVIVDSSSRFESAGLRLRHNICCATGGGCGCGDPVGCGGGVGCGSGVCGGCCTQHADVLVGFRYARLDERLVITEDLETIEEEPPNTQIFGQDRFFTKNQFYGGELGFAWDVHCRRWSLELLSLVAIGNNRQSVQIDGFTTRDTNLAPPETKPGLLLTQTTNIGTYKRDEFTVIPQVGLTAGYQLTPRLKATLGYTLVYWGNVVRPGDQIDLEVNPALLDFPPDPNPLPARPSFAFNETDFWAHGLSIGGEMRW